MAFDLSITKYITGIYLGASTALITPAIEADLLSKPAAGEWSNWYAMDLNDPNALDANSNTRSGGVLPNEEDSTRDQNYQINALYDFLSLYSVTRDNGSSLYGRDDLSFVSGDTEADKETIRSALFGNGSKEKGLIRKVLIGDAPGKGKTEADMDPHERMRDVLSALDIDADPSNGHQNHFHIYLRPPERVGIEDSAANQLLASAEPENQEVNSAAEVPIKEQSFDAVYSQCQTLAQTDDLSWKDLNLVGPSSGGLIYFKSRELKYDLSTWKTIVINSPEHGELKPVLEKVGSVVDFLFIPDEGYFGPDQMTYILEAEGKRIKVLDSVYVGGLPEDGHEGCEGGFGIEEIKQTSQPEKGSSLDILELPGDSSLSVKALVKLHQHVSFSLGNDFLPRDTRISFENIGNGSLGDKKWGQKVGVSKDLSALNLVRHWRQLSVY